MLNEIINNSIRFVVLILLQVLLLNNIQFSGLINPFLYVLFILSLPIETPIWLVLILGFFTGITVDAFCDTMGLHATATTFMAYMRGYILKLFAPREGYEFGMKPTLYSLGTAWFAYYSGILVVLHHLVLFYLEIFRFSEFFFTLGKVILSSTITIVLIFTAQFIIYKRKEGYSNT